jgi:hypothetical protein
MIIEAVVGGRGVLDPLITLLSRPSTDGTAPASAAAPRRCDIQQILIGILQQVSSATMLQKSLGLGCPMSVAPYLGLLQTHISTP